jgi:hypothetical protein
MRLTAGHQAKVEEKPEVRKAGGVYYTPTYIVDYIVKNTVGRMREGGPPARLTDVRDHLGYSYASTREPSLDGEVTRCLRSPSLLSA